MGHYQYECPNWEDKANFAEYEEEEELLLMAHTHEEENSVKKVWFLDSGCSNHMCGHKDWFFDLNEQIRVAVKLGNDSRLITAGKGSVKLEIDGIVQVISDVYYIPDLKSNLLSIGKLQEKGFTMIFKGNICKVYHNERGLILQSKMSSNRMFIVMAKILIVSCFKASTEDLAHLWHCRYGHLGHKGLQMMTNKKMVRGIPKLSQPSKICSDCLKGKQHRETFPNQSSWRASQKLELIHVEICGPIRPESHNKKRYFISFIDDYSRKTWVSLLAEKSAALESFKNFKALVEKESGCLIKCLRTDRGGVFTSKEFEEFCRSNGIK